jgi:hypothetical protein
MPEPRDDERELDRLWNDLIRGQMDPAGYGTDPTSTKIVRAFQAMALPPPQESCHRVDREVLAAIEKACKSQELKARSNAAISSTSWSANGSGRPVVLAPAPSTPRPHWRLTSFAPFLTAALVLFTFIGSYVAFHGPFRSHQQEAATVLLPAIVSTPDARSPASAVSTTPLLEVTLPAGTLGAQAAAPAPRIGWIFQHYAINPGERVIYPNDCSAPNFVVRYILRGTYAVKASGPLQVIRKAADPEATVEEVPPRQEITLHAGDGLIYHNLMGDQYEGFRNPGPDRLELLEWEWLEQSCLGAIPSGMELRWDTFPGKSTAELDRLPFDRSRPLSLRLREITAAPGAELPQDGPDGQGLLPPGTLGLEVAAAEQGSVAVTDTAPKGTYQPLGSDLPPSGGVIGSAELSPRDSTRTIRSTGDEPLLLYVLTIVNTDDAPATSPDVLHGREETPMHELGAARSRRSSLSRVSASAALATAYQID